MFEYEPNETVKDERAKQAHRFARSLIGGITELNARKERGFRGYICDGNTDTHDKDKENHHFTFTHKITPGISFKGETK